MKKVQDRSAFMFKIKCEITSGQILHPLGGTYTPGNFKRKWVGVQGPKRVHMCLLSSYVLESSWK